MRKGVTCLLVTMVVVACSNERPALDAKPPDMLALRLSCSPVVMRDADSQQSLGCRGSLHNFTASRKYVAKTLSLQTPGEAGLVELLVLGSGGRRLETTGESFGPDVSPADFGWLAAGAAVTWNIDLMGEFDLVPDVYKVQAVYKVKEVPWSVESYHPYLKELRSNVVEVTVGKLL